VVLFVQTTNLTVLKPSFLLVPESNSIRRWNVLKLTISSSVIKDGKNKVLKGTLAAAVSNVASPSASKPYIWNESKF
jgi:hypothetical protein